MPRNHVIPLFIPHAGCPHQCVFCNQAKITGQTTPVTPEDVRSQLLAGAARCEVPREAAFYGGSFTALPVEVQDALLAPAAALFEEGILQHIRLSTRPDAVDAAGLRLLRSRHVDTVELGCQSMDDTVLQLAERGHTAEDVRRAAGAVRDAGLHLVLQMMTGLPGDTPESAVRTARALIDLKPDGVRVYPTVVLRGTALEAQMRAGTYTPHTVEDAVALCAKLYPMFLSAGIPVIRLGLNPTEDLSGGEAVAGAYHSALGELVLSRIYRDRADALIAALPVLPEEIVLHVHPKRVSVMTGQKRETILWLRRRWAPCSLTIRPDGAELWDLSLSIH